MTPVRNGQTTHIDLTVRDGVVAPVLTVSAKCHGPERGINHLIWVVRISWEGRAASFKYRVSSILRENAERIDFECFADCIVTDAVAAYRCSGWRDFADSMGYYADGNARSIYNDCCKAISKLNFVFNNDWRTLRYYTEFNDGGGL